MNSIYRPCRPCLTTSNNIKTQRAQRRKGTYLPYLNTSNHTSAPWTLNSVLRIIIPLHYKTLLLNNVDKTRSIIRLFQNKNPAAENIAVFWGFRKCLCFSVICLPPYSTHKTYSTYNPDFSQPASRCAATGIPSSPDDQPDALQPLSKRPPTTIPLQNSGKTTVSQRAARSLVYRNPYRAVFSISTKNKVLNSWYYVYNRGINRSEQHPAEAYAAGHRPLDTKQWPLYI